MLERNFEWIISSKWRKQKRRRFKKWVVEASAAKIVDKSRMRLLFVK
jgi:hypothetical protein